MVNFFSLGYMDSLELPTNEYRQKQKKVREFFEELTCSKGEGVAKLVEHSKKLKSRAVELQTKLVSLKKDVKMLKKYIPFRYRVKFLFRALFTE